MWGNITETVRRAGRGRKMSKQHVGRFHTEIFEMHTTPLPLPLLPLLLVLLLPLLLLVLLLPFFPSSSASFFFSSSSSSSLYLS